MFSINVQASIFVSKDMYVLPYPAGLSTGQPFPPRHSKVAAFL
jgi:hypothetical protein